MRVRKKEIQNPQSLMVSPGKAIEYSSVLLIKWWKRHPVIVLLPNEPIRIRSKKSRCRLQVEVLKGEVRMIPLGESQKRLLIKRGMDAQLIASGRVFAVSEERSARFEKEGKAAADVLRKCGISGGEFGKMVAVRERLSNVKPNGFDEKLAVHHLRKQLSTGRVKDSSGRLERIPPKDHAKIRTEGLRLKEVGMSRDEIEGKFADEYGVSASYVRGIRECTGARGGRR